MTPEEIKEQRDWLDKLAGYTPGPWFPHDFSGAHDGEPNVRDACVSCTHPDHMPVCYMGAAEFGWTGQYCLDRANKNARLIAAAPDLRDRYAAALDEIEAISALLAEARAEALREAAKICNENRDVSGWVSRDAILALIDAPCHADVLLELANASNHPEAI